MEAADQEDGNSGINSFRRVQPSTVLIKMEAADQEDGNDLGHEASPLKLETFDANFRSLSQEESLEGTTEQNPLKIICVGDYTGGVRTKGVLIRDYLGIKPTFRSHSFTCVDFFLKKVEWKRRGHFKSGNSINVQLCEISEMERFSAMTKVYFKYSQGALVFWGPHNPSSLHGAVQWRKKIEKEVSRVPIPCVLVTDNVSDSCVKSLEWIGPGKIFESEATLDQFCKHHGFVDHFEIKSRDWESGEKSVFGQAVNCLLDEILQNEQKEEKTWI